VTGGETLGVNGNRGQNGNSPLFPTLSPLNLSGIDNGDNLLELLLPSSFSAKPSVTPLFENFSNPTQEIDNTLNINAPSDIQANRFVRSGT
jgi:hypothetical protein